MTDRRFVSVHAPRITEIRERVALAQCDPELEDTSLDQLDLNFKLRSEDDRIHFELHVLPDWLEGGALKALVLDVVMHYSDGSKTSFQPETDTWVNILVEEDADGNTRASIPESELRFFTLE